MMHTTADLMKYFNPVAAYTESDEISLIFDAADNQDPSDPNFKETVDYQQRLLFRGRVMNIVTLAAGYCSVRFNYHLSRFIEEGMDPKVTTVDVLYDLILLR
jgi:tRNA(His) 5'-end guanylyltransferase